MNAFCCVLSDEIESENNLILFRDYVGQALWHITTIQHMKTEEPNDMPQYIEMAHPEQVSPEEELTAEQIINNVLEKLG